jgi:hypothetical protein
MWEIGRSATIAGGIAENRRRIRILASLAAGDRPTREVEQKHPPAGSISPLATNCQKFRVLRFSILRGIAAAPPACPRGV